MPNQRSDTLPVVDLLPGETFGDALRFLRKRARLTQEELGRAVGYSREQIARLETGSRLPDLTVIAALFIPALELKRETALVARLLQLAEQTRHSDSGRQRITVTRTVRKRITVEDEISASSPVVVPAPVAVDRRAHALPAPMLPLIGRKDALARAIALLAGDARLLTLVGAPGVGKTRLALEIADALAPAFAHAACFVSLAPVQAVEDAPAAVAEALRITLAAGQSPAEAVQAYLVPRELLLLLDNCEHLLDAAPQFADWLTAAPRLRLLCTSRTALDLYGEFEMMVPPLAVPNLAALPTLAVLGKMPAVQLFVARTQAVNAAFELNEQNGLDVAALCVALDGLPLALELAAARGRQLAPGAILGQLMAGRGQQDVTAALLSQTRRGIAERHRTLHDAIAWSVRLLAADQRAVFLKLGVFVGGCTPAAAAAVCDASDEILASLASASLLRLEDGANGPRVMLLETLRAYALEQLAVAGQLTAAQEQHARFFAGLAQEIFEGVRGEEQAAWLARARAEHDNFRAGLRIALDQAKGDLAVQIAGGLWWFWYRQGFLHEGRAWLDASLRCASETAAPGQASLRKRQRAIALNGAGAMATEQGDFVAAMSYHQAGLALRQELGDAQGVAIALHNMALAARCQGDYDRALAWFEESLVGFEQSTGLTRADAHADYIMGQANIGITACEMGNYDLAQQRLEDAWTAARQQRNDWAVAFISSNLAEVYRHQNDWERAAALAAQSLRLFTQLDDAFYIPEPILILARMALTQGDLPAARDRGADVLRRYQALNDRHGISLALQFQAWLALAETPHPPGAEQAAALWGAAQPLRASANRSLSPVERHEEAAMLDALNQRLGPAQAAALLKAGAATGWRAVWARFSQPVPSGTPSPASP